MKIGVAVLFLAGLSAVVTGRDNPSTTQALAPSVGLEIGQEAPTFALPDQFGHRHTNETLKGPNGTVLLFFRSADW
jgi:cytochrome oxidase Cu insertion factor (SCO1/SenC/PrrC family)